MLAHINLVGWVGRWDIHDDDERVILQLLDDNKLKMVYNGPDYLVKSVNATPYQPETDGPHPVVFFLASQNPSNEGYVQVYRKNWYIPELPEYNSVPVENELDVIL